MRREVKSNSFPNILSLQPQISIGQKSDMGLTKLKQGFFTFFSLFKFQAKVGFRGDSISLPSAVSRGHLHSLA